MSDVIKRYGNTMLGYYPGLDCTIIFRTDIGFPWKIRKMSFVKFFLTCD